jgi:hypothetical protein
MKFLNILFGIFFLGSGLSAQCTLYDVKAFYYTPNLALEEDSQKRVKIVLTNVSDVSNWSFTYEYGPKGFEAGQGLGTEGSYTFTSVDERMEFMILLDIEDDQKYDFYICDEYLGEFQDARELLEVNLNFEFQNNRLYYIPLRNKVQNAVYPDFDENSMSFFHFELEDGNYFNNLKRMDMSYSSGFQTHELAVLNMEIPFLLSLSHKEPLDCDCSYMNIMLKTNGVLSWGMAYYLQGFSMNLENTWENSTFEISKDDYNIFDDNYYIEQGAIMEIYTQPSSSSLPHKCMIDDFVIRPLATRLEICAGKQIEIYGEMQSKEGIYVDTVLSSDGIVDSVVYTTLIHHPPLFVDIIGDGNYKVTGAWETVEWRDCITDQVYGYGSEFQAIENGSFYAIVSDGICTDTTACVELTNLSIEDVKQEKAIIYPNPNNGNFFIQLAPFQGTVNIVVSDILGKNVFEKEILSGNENEAIEVEDLESGIYLISIFDKQKMQYHEKVIVR